ncbi:murein biosynthesis integral membrane protein MurJ [uncultured Desulfovibrio sp.]|uniref:murein biosynthesis integral membrane protein MurJ n=1 Tax=uncultured Desulfovibrio sp. TaxID=167968 RepID=UPI00261C89C8|nr:murein biosynthesis integral membrane protein MurJ [uncultured Desulfovibrio sp.]
MGLLSGKQRMGAAALLLAVSTILSRLMGLVRDKVISWQFGAGSEADMYFAAFVVPDMINHLLAGGIMSITIIPLLSRRFAEDEEDGWRFFSCVFCWMAIASVSITGAGMLGAHALARITAPGFSEAQLQRLAFFMRIILPAQVFFLCGACMTALLFLRRQFRVPALTPLIYNGCIILGGISLPVLTAGLNLPPQWELGGMSGYCLGVTAGAALGAFWLPWRVARSGGLHLHWRLSHPLLRRFFVMALPLMLGQTIILLDEQFMRVFGSLLTDGSVSLLNYARRITQVPVGLMGQAAAVASYPFLVDLITRGERQRFDATLATALRASVGLIIPCALWLGVAAGPVLGVIFQGGRFGAAETLACTPLLQIMLAATPMWIIYMVLVRAFYADGDTITPAVTGTIMTLLVLPCYYWWAVPRGAWAVSGVSSVSICLYVLWLMVIWARRRGCGAYAGLVSISLRVLACALPAAAAAWLLQEYLRSWLASGALWTQPAPILEACLVLTGSGLTFVFCFLPLSAWLAPGVLAPLWKRLRRA